MNKWRSIIVFLRGGLFLSLALLSGCKGGGGSDNLITLMGTAATGAPMQGLVTVTNALGQVSQQAVIDSDGQFSVLINDVPPFFLMAQDFSTGLTLFSISFGDPVANITPFSDVLLRSLLPGENMLGIFNTWQVSRSNVLEQSISLGVRVFNVAVSPTYESFGINPLTFNFLKTQFNADNAGFDAVLDAVGVELPIATQVGKDEILFVPSSVLDSYLVWLDGPGSFFTDPPTFEESFAAGLGFDISNFSPFAPPVRIFSLDTPLFILRPRTDIDPDGIFSGVEVIDGYLDFNIND